MNAFFVVWEPKSGYTKHKHQSYFEALKESRRLAVQNPGEEFVVLQARSSSRIEDPVKITEYEQPRDMPF